MKTFIVVRLTDGKKRWLKIDDVQSTIRPRLVSKPMYATAIEGAVIASIVSDWFHKNYWDHENYATREFDYLVETEPKTKGNK
jgi:hypothetical protein